MLQLEGVTWTLPGGEEIVRGVDLEIGDGKLVVITGPNGGGKTSLVKLIAGVEQATTGKILLDGEEITHMDVTERARRGVAYAFQQPVKFKGLTVGDLLELAAGKVLTEEELCDLLAKVGLCAREYVDRELSAALSGGESKRIEIATVLARGAKLSIFDEPEAGIDLWSFSRLVETFESLRRTRKGTLLVISHQERILSIADEIVVIDQGRVKTHGPRFTVLPTLLSDQHACGCPQGKGGLCYE